MREKTLVAQKVFRTGVQSLWVHPGGWHSISIKNRTYSSEHPIPPEKVAYWRELLK